MCHVAHTCVHACVFICPVRAVVFQNSLICFLLPRKNAVFQWHFGMCLRDRHLCKRWTERDQQTDVWNIQPFGIKEVPKMVTLYMMDSLLVKNEWSSVRIGISVKSLLFSLFYFHDTGTPVAHWLRCCATNTEVRWFDSRWCHWNFSLT